MRLRALDGGIHSRLLCRGKQLADLWLQKIMTQNIYQSKLEFECKIQVYIMCSLLGTL